MEKSGENNSQDDCMVKENKNDEATLPMADFNDLSQAEDKVNDLNVIDFNSADEVRLALKVLLKAVIPKQCDDDKCCSLPMHVDTKIDSKNVCQFKTNDENKHKESQNDVTINPNDDFIDLGQTTHYFNLKTSDVNLAHGTRQTTAMLLTEEKSAQCEDFQICSSEQHVNMDTNVKNDNDNKRKETEKINVKVGETIRYRRPLGIDTRRKSSLPSRKRPGTPLKRGPCAKYKKPSSKLVYCSVCMKRNYKYDSSSEEDS